MRSGVSERFFKISVENPVVVDVVNALAHYIERHIQLTLRSAENARACVIRSAATANSELRIPNSEFRIKNHLSSASVTSTSPVELSDIL